VIGPAPWAGRRLHLVGLGGAGMSAYALAARALGADVSGSDAAESPYLEPVRAAGIRVAIGQDAANLPGGDDL
jgi:UDP-N-acetylmuramate--alanine ligase